MLIPKNRHEYYLAVISGNDYPTFPPKTREELYLAKLAGREVDVPTPRTPKERAYYNIINDIKFEPENRWQTFVAAANDDSITAPIPITREEIWWSNISLSHEVIVEYIGTLPATLRTVAGYLESYKIYGNTEQNGTPTLENPIMPSGCGERTGNVMPAGEQKTVVSNGVTFSSDGNGRYHISGTATAGAIVRFNLLSAFTTPISVSNGGQGTLSFFNTQSNGNVAFVFCNGASRIDDWRQMPIRRTHTNYNVIGNKYVDNVEIVVSSGETVDITITPEFTNDGIIPSEFEPYGYKLPILSNSIVTDIYIGNAQLAKDEYVSYPEQKIYRRTLFIAHDNKHFITKDNKDFCLRRESYNG